MLKAGSSRPVQKLQILKRHERADNQYSETISLGYINSFSSFKPIRVALYN